MALPQALIPPSGIGSMVILLAVAVGQDPHLAKHTHLLLVPIGNYQVPILPMAY